MSDPETDAIINPDQPGAESFLSDLISDAQPAPAEAEVEADPTPGADGQPPKVEGEPKTEAAKPEPEAKPAGTEPVADPAVKTYEYNGRQYTANQLIELGVLDDVLQTARQFPTIQKKYQTLLEKEKGVAEPGAPGSQTVEAPAAPTGEAIHRAYLPEVQRMVQAGYVEPEAYEAFPLLTTSLMYHRDMLYDMHRAMQVLVQREVDRGKGDEKSQFLNYLDGLCGKVSGQGEHFKLLADDSIKQDFYKYLGTLRIPASEVDEAFVRRQWAAFNSEAMLEAASSAASGATKEAADRKRRAKGEGGAPRGSTPAPARKGSDTELIDSFLEG
jgi:hypothetical protein